MRSTKRLTTRIVTAALGALSIAALSVAGPAAPAHAKPGTPVPVCTGAHALLVDVTQEVRNDYLMPARDGRMWAAFSYTQRVRIWSVGGRQHCVRKDLHGTWESIAGTSPGLTGTISDGVTGTFTSTEYFEWTGELVASAPVSGHLGSIDADCSAAGVCADDGHLILNNLYFADGYQHCTAVRAFLEVDGGAHGQLSLAIDGGLHKVSGSGDITG